MVMATIDPPVEQKDIVQVLNGLEGRVWEKCLNLGAFKRLQVLETRELPYSQIARGVVFCQQGVVGFHAKLYRNARQEPLEVLRHKVIRDYGTLEFWWGQFRQSPTYRVVQPLYCSPDNLLIITRTAEGVPLYKLLLAAPRNMEAAQHGVRLAGEWLRYFLSSVPDEPVMYDPAQLLEYMEVRLKRLESDSRRHFPTGLGDRIRRFVESQGQRLSSEERRVHLSHSDYNPGNILIQGNRITVLDFGRRVPESYLLDLSRLYHQLELFTYKPRFSRKRIARLQEVLLQGFGDPAAVELPIFRLLLLRHLVNHVVTISNYWRQSLPEMLYNRWVVHQEIKWIQRILS